MNIFFGEPDNYGKNFLKEFFGEGKEPEGALIGIGQGEDFNYFALFIPKPYKPEDIDVTGFYPFTRSEGELACAGFANDSDFTGEFKAGLYIFASSNGPCGASVIGYVTDSDKFDIDNSAIRSLAIIEAFEDFENGELPLDDYDKVMEGFGIRFTEA